MCKDYTDEQMVVNTGGDPWAEKWLETGAGKDWLEAHGFFRDIAIAPPRECNNSDPRPTIEFRDLNDGDTITENKIDVRAVIDATDGIKSWVLEYGMGDNPEQWKQIADGKKAVGNPTTLINWDLNDIGNNTVTLRLYVTGESGYAEHRISLTVELPTPTPTPTSTPTATLPPLPTGTPTLTPTATKIIVPTDTQTNTATATVTLFPSDTPTP